MFITGLKSGRAVLLSRHSRREFLSLVSQLLEVTTSWLTSSPSLRANSVASPQPFFLVVSPLTKPEKGSLIFRPCD